MKTRPILFSGEMVRGILDGRKTQTRRVVKRLTPDWIQGMDFDICHDPPHIAVHHHGNSYAEIIPCPYGVPGDRLWVRETWATDGVYDDTRPVLLDEFIEPFYRASGESAGRWRPSIHMPRWASRITLEVLSVRVERVQEISNVDARAEGCIGPVTRPPSLGDIYDTTEEINEHWGRVERTDGSACEVSRGFTAGRDEHWFGFKEVWDSINAKRGYGWESNPWVWVVGFKVVGG